MELLLRNEVKAGDCSELKKQIEALQEKLRESELRSADLKVKLELILTTFSDGFYQFLEFVGQARGGLAGTRRVH